MATLRTLRPLCALAALPRSAVFTPTISKRTYAYGHTQVKALVHSKYGPPSDVLSLHSHSISPAHDSEILVKFLAAPINPADINQIEGVYPSKQPMTTALGTTNPAAVPGSEGVVEVVSVGADVRDFAPGDRAVMKRTAFGTWRTHAVAQADQLLKIPAGFESITPIQAATVSVNPCTAYQMLREFTTLQRGDWFIHNGANSGVGRAAIQFGRNWGLHSIAVVRDRPDLAELKKELEGLGADAVVTAEELAADRNSVREIAGDREIKLALNCVGGKATTALALTLAEGGHIVTYGGMAPKKSVSLPPSAYIFRDLHSHGFWVSRWSDRNPDKKVEMLKDIFGMMVKGEFVEAPVEETIWGQTTEVGVLKEAVEKSQKGFGGKKQVFVIE